MALMANTYGNFKFPDGVTQAFYRPLPLVHRGFCNKFLTSGEPLCRVPDPRIVFHNFVQG